MAVRGDSHPEAHVAFRARDVASMRMLSREDEESAEHLRLILKTELIPAEVLNTRGGERAIEDAIP